MVINNPILMEKSAQRISLAASVYPGLLITKWYSHHFTLVLLSTAREKIFGVIIEHAPRGTHFAFFSSSPFECVFVVEEALVRTQHGSGTVEAGV
jgi:hypothetical protein